MNLATHWLTPEERSFFRREGYLVVRDALSEHQVVRLRQAITRCGQGHGKALYNRANIFGLDDAFLELATNPAVLAKICGLMGWNIWVNHTHYNVRPPDTRGEPYPYDWHRDGGTIGLDLQDENPLTAIKVAFYLTDLTQPQRGQTYIIPHSYAHARELAQSLRYQQPPPDGAVPIMVPAGSAVLFQQNVHHSQGSPNFSDLSRQAIFMQWAYRWLFPLDGMTVDHLEPRISDPVLRQMLGFDQERMGNELSARYYPNNIDVPLRYHLIEKVGLARLCEIGPATSRYLTRFLRFKSAPA